MPGSKGGCSTIPVASVLIEIGMAPFLWRFLLRRIAEPRRLCSTRPSSGPLLNCQISRRLKIARAVPPQISPYNLVSFADRPDDQAGISRHVRDVLHDVIKREFRSILIKYGFKEFAKLGMRRQRETIHCSADRQQDGGNTKGHDWLWQVFQRDNEERMRDIPVRLGQRFAEPVDEREESGQIKDEGQVHGAVDNRLGRIDFFAQILIEHHPQSVPVEDGIEPVLDERIGFESLDDVAKSSGVRRVGNSAVIDRILADFYSRLEVFPSIRTGRNCTQYKQAPTFPCDEKIADRLWPITTALKQHINAHVAYDNQPTECNCGTRKQILGFDGQTEGARDGINQRHGSGGEHETRKNKPKNEFRAKFER